MIPGMHKISFLMLILLSFLTFAHSQTAPEKKPHETLAEETVTLINLERQKKGLTPLTVDPHLRDYAVEWAEHMAQEEKMSHRTNRDMLAFIDQYGMNGITENVACTTKPWTAENVVSLWMKSPGHRANLLRKDSRICGVGFSWKNGRGYAVFNGARQEMPAKGN